MKKVSRFSSRPALLRGLALWSLGLSNLVGCGSNSLNGGVGDVSLQVEDGFYTEFDWQGTSYVGVVLTDVEDACNVFRASEPTPGPTYGIFQIWFTQDLEGDYPTYAFDHLDEADGDYSLVWFNSVINDQEVVNTDAVAGFGTITRYDSEEHKLNGTLEVFFSGEGNNMSGAFSVPYCEVDWASVAVKIFGGTL